MDADSPDRSLSRRRFRIWVAGRLDTRFVEGVAGIELGDSPLGSTLEGPFLDQSQLRGILDRLWQLGIEILRFETYLPDATDSDAS